MLFSEQETQKGKGHVRVRMKSMQEFNPGGHRLVVLRMKTPGFAMLGMEAGASHWETGALSLGYTPSSKKVKI